MSTALTGVGQRFTAANQPRQAQAASQCLEPCLSAQQLRSHSWLRASSTVLLRSTDSLDTPTLGWSQAGRQERNTIQY